MVIICGINGISGFRMVEGKGYCARRQERKSLKQMAEFVENRDKIVVIPDLKDESNNQ